MSGFLVHSKTRDKEVYALNRALFEGDEHPWKMRVWHEDGQWVCSVRPGFVNGLPVLIDKEMLTGWGTGAGTGTGREGGMETRYARIRSVADGQVENWGRQEDVIALPESVWRAVDGVGEVIPDFFAAMGVKGEKGEKGGKEVMDSFIAGGEGVRVDATKFDKATGGEIEGAPKLLATEVYLRHARATTSVSVDIPANIVTGQLVEYSVGLNVDNVMKNGYRASLLVGQVPAASNPLEVLLLGGGGDDGWDYVHIGKIYLMGDGGTGPENQPFVAYETFWNLCYAAKIALPQNSYDEGLDPALAFFIGRVTVVGGGMVGATRALEDQLQSAVAAATDNGGRWWTI
jgi:hypothetical protein